MKIMNSEELDKVSGGGVEWFGIGLAVAAILVFISGIFEGYTNPGSCS